MHFDTIFVIINLVLFSYHLVSFSEKTNKQNKPKQIATIIRTLLVQIIDSINHGYASVVSWLIP